MRTGTDGVFVQEVDDNVTEMITTSNEREANYVHQGWSLSAASTIPPWASSRITQSDQHNSQGVWITKRILIQRLTFNVSRKELAPVPEFEADIRAALEKPTTAEMFQAVHNTLQDWLVIFKLILTYERCYSNQIGAT
jgi:hypothetical protein